VVFFPRSASSFQAWDTFLLTKPIENIFFFYRHVILIRGETKNATLYEHDVDEVVQPPLQFIFFPMDGFQMSYALGPSHDFVKKIE
jgi:hypothetical protein